MLILLPLVWASCPLINKSSPSVSSRFVLTLEYTALLNLWVCSSVASSHAVTLHFISILRKHWISTHRSLSRAILHQISVLNAVSDSASTLRQLMQKLQHALREKSFLISILIDVCLILRLWLPDTDSTARENTVSLANVWNPSRILQGSQIFRTHYTLVLYWACRPMRRRMIQAISFNRRTMQDLLCQLKLQNYL